MGILQRIFNRSPSATRFELVTERGNGFYAWNGKVYQSDIVRSCLRPKVKAVGKLVAKHIRRTADQRGKEQLEINPLPYIRVLLEEPNPYMTGQKLQEKLATQLCLNNNAFALIIRDEAGFPEEIYPIPAVACEAIYDKNGVLFLRFYLNNGKRFTFPYSDIIHLRQDFNDNDIFGEPLAPVLAPLMEIVAVTDQGIIKAIKNSSVIRWLLQFNAVLRQEDIKNRAREFAESFMSVGNGTGVAATDAKAEATQITPKDYVPNAAQMDRTEERIRSLFNTNKKIIQSSYNEDEWNAYYEAEIEPTVIEMGGEYTRKLFSKRERYLRGESIVFEAANLATASMATKLNLCQMVDRGALTPNEWRAVLNLAPIEGGDKPIRRLDTQVVKGGEDN